MSQRHPVSLSRSAAMMATSVEISREGAKAPGLDAARCASGACGREPVDSSFIPRFHPEGSSVCVGATCAACRLAGFARQPAFASLARSLGATARLAADPRLATAPRLWHKRAPKHRWWRDMQIEKAEPRPTDQGERILIKLSGEALAGEGAFG